MRADGNASRGLGAIIEYVNDFHFQRAYFIPTELSASWSALLFNDEGQLLLQESDGSLIAPPLIASVICCATLSNPIGLGALNQRCVIADDAPAEAQWPSNYRFVGLREIYASAGEDLYALAGFAWQLLYFRKNNQFCSRCGSQTLTRENDWGRPCASCDAVVYPRLNPAILASVTDNDRILLVHKPGWGERYSIVAGFVDPCESLEDTVRREVKEETGVDVTDIRYVGSQPWSFPHQLMIAFTSRYVGAEIQINDTEIDDARWFTADNMPKELPQNISLSRQIIDSWLEDQRRK
jgi:NAD+ diphosphatase